MSASHIGNQRRFRIVGDRLRTERDSLGLTQLELAHRAGYTDRLIRKAESCGRLNRQSLCDIVAALQEFGSKICEKDLVFDPVSAARRFVDAYEEYGRDMIQHSQSVLSEDLVFECVGDPSCSPIAGRFHGLDGLQEWLDIFLGIFDRVQDSPLNATFFACENSVVARYSERVCHGERIAPPIWVNLYFVIRDGLIVEIRNEYDTLAGTQFIAECGIGTKAFDLADHKGSAHP